MEPGSLALTLTWDGKQIVAAEVVSTRPAVARALSGLPAARVLELIPRLFGLCPRAQEAAARLSLAAARGEQVASSAAAPALAVALEAIGEHLWRLLLDWPPALGLPPEKEAFIAWRATRFGGNCAGETKKLLVDTLDELAEKCLAKLVDRATDEAPLGSDRRVHASGAPHPLTPGEWLTGWQEGVAQPVPIAPSSIQAAYQGRVAEVERAAAGLAAGAPYPIAAAGGNGWGAAQMNTARGVLTHAVHLDAGKVAGYRLWAPTDVFFADAAALSGLLAGQRFTSADEARRALDQAILALDPCVPYVLELNDA